MLLHLPHTFHRLQMPCIALNALHKGLNVEKIT